MGRDEVKEKEKVKGQEKKRGGFRWSNHLSSNFTMTLTTGDILCVSVALLRQLVKKKFKIK